jgi:hypothetical protein
MTQVSVRDLKSDLNPIAGDNYHGKANKKRKNCSETALEYKASVSNNSGI